MFGDRALVHEEWFKEVSDKFQLKKLTELKSAELFNHDNTNIQQYFFYDDEDGKASFEHFLATYKNKPDWKIEKNDDFVVLSSAKNGRKIEIYANYPESENEGPEKISEILKQKNLEPTLVVHRGHSYHTIKTIEKMAPTTKVVSLGSCGGSNKGELLLKRAPLVHPISTKGKGTMLVNDTILKMLNAEILTGQNIVWKDFWDKVEKILKNNRDFQDYIPPNKNLGVMLLKTYYLKSQEADSLLTAQK